MTLGNRSVCTVARRVLLTGLLGALICGNAGAGPAETGVVRGVAWNSDNAPIAKGNVRLRNIETGRIVSASETSPSGQFVFAGVTKSAYLVELVSNDGKVLAVGPSFRIEPGETISTVVRLQSRRSWYDGLFSNSAAAVIAAASSVGLTAVGTKAPPISPQ